MTIVIATLIVLISASLLISIWLYRRDPEFGKIFSAVQAMISIAGLLVAAYWFFVERKGMPHANVKLSAQAVRMSERSAMVSVRMSVENKGMTLLTLDQVKISLLAVRMKDSTEDFVLAQDTDSFPARNSSGRELYDKGEFSWKALKSYSTKYSIEIEPGETDTIFVDFIVPCTEHVLRIIGDAKKPVKTDWWYKDRMLIVTTSICNAPLDQTEKIIQTEKIATSSGEKS